MCLASLVASLPCCTGVGPGSSVPRSSAAPHAPLVRACTPLILRAASTGQRAVGRGRSGTGQGAQMADDEVGAYYGRQHAKFLVFGGSGAALAIHRGSLARGRRHGRGGGGPCQRPDPCAGPRRCWAGRRKRSSISAAGWAEVSFISPVSGRKPGFAASPSVPLQCPAPLPRAAARGLAARCRFAEADHRTA